jgi:hypothetical protein
MENTNIKRWSKISLRTLHLVAVAGVGGGILFGIDKQLWLNYWWLALISGALMMLIDAASNPAWLVQVRGVAIILKLILLLFIGWGSECCTGWDEFLLFIIIVISAVISHAPGNLRYFSLYHGRVISSSKDSKG